MEVVVRQRCLHHYTREAVARCPECGLYFCRECITEHDDRVICASCLKRVAVIAEKEPRRRINLWPALQMSGGFLFTWFLFYVVGRLLLSLPENFHEDQLWKNRLMNFVTATGDE